MQMARLAVGVLRALLNCDRYGLSILRIGIILLGAASFLYLLAQIGMAALLPVFFLARRATVARFAAAALFSGQIRQRGSADGALREDHRALRSPLLPTRALSSWGSLADAPLDRPVSALRNNEKSAWGRPEEIAALARGPSAALWCSAESSSSRATERHPRRIAASAGAHERAVSR